MADTGFSHRLTAYKIVGHFFGMSYRKISWNNQVKKVFLESVAFQFHARMLSSEVAQSLKIMNIFRTFGSGSLSVTALLDFSGKANRGLHQSTASKMTTRLGYTLVQHCLMFIWMFKYRPTIQEKYFIDRALSILPLLNTCG